MLSKEKNQREFALAVLLDRIGVISVIRPTWGQLLFM